LRSSAAKIVWLVPEGSRVEAGDTLATFDPTEVQRRVEDLEGRATSARANLEKLRASQAARQAELRAQLQDQRAALRLAEIGAANVEYEAKIEQEKAQLALQRARLDLEQTESKLEAQKSIDAAELTEQQVMIAQTQSQLASERDALGNHIIIAPTEGLVVYGSIWSGNRSTKVKVGDQVYYGGVVLELPDLSQMRLSSWVNEARVDQLRPGLPCEVRIDAFPDTLYRGSVTRVNVLGRELPESEGVKVFDYEVLLEGQDVRLRPGMTATVTVHIAKLDSVIFAPIEAVHQDDGGAWVWRKRGRGVERLPVTVGRSNDFHVELVKGVQAGDMLALRGVTQEEHDATR
jgi:RND family efflux transporter MFP subunit